MLNILHLPNIENLGIAGYWIVFLIAFVESLAFIGLFTPGTVLIVLAGGLSAHGVYDFGDLMFFSVLGAILGDGLSYELGKRYKSRLWQRPRWRQYLAKGRQFIEGHGTKSVILGRFIGPLRPIVPVVAGTVGMRRIPFYMANILSAIGWAICYLALGYVFGAAWKVALLGFSRIALILLIPVLFFILLFWLWRWVVRRGEAILRVLLSVLRSLGRGLRENEYIGPWIEHHPRLIRFLHARFSIQTFTGLPLTLLVLAIAYSLSVFSGIVEDYLTSDPLIALDARLTNLFYAFRSPSLLQFFYGITILANSITVLSVACLLTVLLWKQRRHTYILVLWLTFLGAEGMTMLGKLLFHRPRPSGLLPVFSEESYSFPSGHATSAVVLFGFLAYLLIRERASWKVKVSALFAAATAVLLIDLSRLYLGVHYLSDVLAGNILALSILLFAISVGEWWRSKQRGAFPPFSWMPLSSVLLLQALFVTGFVTLAPLPPQTPVHVAKQEVALDAIPSLFERGILPRYTETLIGTPQEPVNILLIVPDSCLVPSLTKAGWVQADVPSTQTVIRIARAAVLNAGYLTAPMTPSFYDTQPHTIGFEKETEEKSVRSRHHARFWEMAYQTDAGVLYVGTASLDTGIKWGITHAIDPAIDTERDLFVSDLREAGVIANERTLTLVPPTLGKNFTGDPFFTDGKSILLTLRSCR